MFIKHAFGNTINTAHSTQSRMRVRQLFSNYRHSRNIMNLKTASRTDVFQGNPHNRRKEIPQFLTIHTGTVMTKTSANELGRYKFKRFSYI